MIRGVWQDAQPTERNKLSPLTTASVMGPRSIGAKDFKGGEPVVPTRLCSDPEAGIEFAHLLLERRKPTLLLSSLRRARVDIEQEPPKGSSKFQSSAIGGRTEARRDSELRKFLTTSFLQREMLCAIYPTLDAIAGLRRHQPRYRVAAIAAIVPDAGL
jgi:hypothetical protein